MTLSKLLWSLGLVAAGVTSALAGPPAPPAGLPCPPGVIPPATGTPVLPPGTLPAQPDASPLLPAPTSAVGGGGGESGSGGLASGAPNMIGDLGIRGLAVTSQTRFLFGANSISAFNQVISPLAASGPFKIGDNESPLARSRVFLNYNYFEDIGGKFLRNRRDSATLNLANDNVTFTQGAGVYDLHRATVGFERAFLDGRASFGARVPFLYRDGGNGSTVDGIGDVTLIGKFVVLTDCCRRNALSAGVALTVPTSRDVRAPGPEGANFNTWLIQPWVGGLLEGERFYLQGFGAAVLPSVAEDTRLLTADVALGYKLYQCQGGTLTAVIPTVEGHYTAPINNQGIDRVIKGGNPALPFTGQRPAFSDQFVVTAGSHFGIGERTWLTLAIGVPVAGPRLFDWEGVLQLNVGF